MPNKHRNFNFERINKLSLKLFWFMSSLLRRNDLKNLRTLRRRRNVDGPGEDEYVCSYNGSAFVDPAWGYVISRGGYLFEESMKYNDIIRQAPWRIGLPDPIVFRKARASRTTVRKIPKAILLRHFWEWNYYHFYVDVLGKLNLIFETGIDRNTPIILGSYVNDAKFPVQILKTGELAHLNWIVPGKGEFIEVEEIIFCRTKQSMRERLFPIVDLMEVNAAPRTDDLIFLTRSQTATRHIVNNDEVESLLISHGFRVVDTQKLSIDDQIELFARTRFLVAIHGAGITNVIFRKGLPMDVIELHPENYTASMFSELADQFGFGWTRIVCKTTEGNIQHANIIVDIDLLETHVRTMLQNSVTAIDD